MKRSFLLLMLVSVSGLLFVGSAFAYTIEDKTLVGIGHTNDDDGYYGETDYIGQGYDIDRIEVSRDGTEMTVDIYSDYDGLNVPLVGGLELTAADLFLDLDGDGDYEKAVAFTEHDGFQIGEIYDVDATDVTTSHAILDGNTDGTNYMYGEFWITNSDELSPWVQASGSSPGSDATLASQFPVKISGDDADYLWSLTIDLSGLGYSFGNDIGLFLASATCANDIIEGRVPVPEPATMLLFGMGLIGLAGFGRKKFIKF